MKAYLLLCCVLLTACSSLPPAISDPPHYDLSYSEASQNLTKYKNAPVRWGGVIVDVANEENRSLIQILSYPLSSQGRPLTDQPHQGRFVISSPEFLDPAVYEKDTQITVAGMLAGEIDRTVDKKVLHLPLLSLTALHLWPDYTNNPMYGSYGTYNAYYGYPGWGGAFYRPIFFPPPR
ncbi:Slp family lipoprotein [Methylovulum psychrotolerans]|jgi:outer membrane lipoprotein|uniref:Outer membrane protein slp n=1 Tax=Methylovulum psychrotolerans TaxID=1704499 RepID=A0A1Z4BVK5_9GAMM|nr:Slp family lipoprotein [Methylovulum psychrotolerans]ASF45308.1 hypothetical protein CEK71_04075 [Methylovulum psychrotolerans]MBT9096574.1 Slp family lipoprotein [Methylovulum psychrotolerans]POZ49763.1 Outer membrane protein slp [Methylovulum psychrotolerans]